MEGEREQTFPLSDAEYTKLIRVMTNEAAIKSTFGRRNGYEQTYFLHHQARGTKQTREKYRYGR